MCLTIDTGASNSIIKRGKIKNGSKVTKDSTQFNGLVKDQQFRSLAKVKIDLLIEGAELEHTFFVVPDRINLKNDGIIGIDFLKKYQTKIDYSKNRLKFLIKMPISSVFPRQTTQNASTATTVPKNGGKTTINDIKIKRKITQDELKATEGATKNTINELNSTMSTKTSSNTNEMNKTMKQSPEIPTELSNNCIETKRTSKTANTERKVRFTDKNEQFIYHSQSQLNTNKYMKPKVKEKNPDFYKNLPIE